MKEAIRIHVLEDNEWYNKLLVHNLKLNPDFSVHGFSTAKAFLAELKNQPDIVTLDYRLPDMDGRDVLHKIKAFSQEIEVIVISEQNDIETAVGLLKEGAYDYLVKSKDIKERLHNTILNIRKNRALKKELSSLKKEVQQKYNFQQRIIGDSPAIKKVFELIEKAVRTNITVSVTGETGTGKEVVAKAIHYNSNRKDQPLVAVNVAAIPSELIESELFGHEKGAFTGANFRRIGKFEEAHGGTLFLDEIGEMSQGVQVKLLRALQEKEVTRIGSNQPITVDCRIVVATNKNLMELVNAKTFREDLFYRLYGLSIHLPPLRERGQDTLLLARYFLNNFCKDNRLENKSLHPEAQQKLQHYSFPGNVRELKSVVELAATMAVEKEITAGDISLASNGTLHQLFANEMSMREYELQILAAYLKKYNNDTKLVAEKLGIGIATVYRMMKEMNNTEG
jgi:two-component system response regulator AtoC